MAATVMNATINQTFPRAFTGPAATCCSCEISGSSGSSTLTAGTNRYPRFGTVSIYETPSSPHPPCNCLRRVNMFCARVASSTNVSGQTFAEAPFFDNPSLILHQNQQGLKSLGSELYL